MEKNSAQTWRLRIALAGLLTLASLPAAADSILGKKVVVKNPGSESQRSVVMLAKEDATDIAALRTCVRPAPICRSSPTTRCSR